MSQDRATPPVPSGRLAPSRTATGINPVPYSATGGAIPQDPRAQAELAVSIQEQLIPLPTFKKRRTADSSGPVQHDVEDMHTSTLPSDQDIKNLHHGILHVAVMAREFSSGASREVGWDLHKPWVEEHSAPVYQRIANGMVLGDPVTAAPNAEFSISSTDIDFKWVTYPEPREGVDLRLPEMVNHNDVDWAYGSFGTFENVAPVWALGQTPGPKLTPNQRDYHDKGYYLSEAAGKIAGAQRIHLKPSCLNSDWFSENTTTEFDIILKIGV